jgi:hypothetical protein
MRRLSPNWEVNLPACLEKSLELIYEQSFHPGLRAAAARESASPGGPPMQMKAG